MRVTESSNPLTQDIDALPAAELLDRLGAAEAQIFGSEEWGPGLFDSVFLDELGRARNRLRAVLAHSGGRVVLAGSGTSGRIAVHAAAHWRAVHGENKIRGLIAGGPEALFQAREGIEDLPEIGKEDLAEVLPPDAPFALVGISCGLSAAYVAGQVALALERGASAVVMIGFNPLEAASSRPLPFLGRSLREILSQMVQVEGGFLLNPIIGPEPIAGSTRMKGGTATRIVLDLLLSDEEPEFLLQGYRQLLELFRAKSRALVPIVERATQTLLHGAGLIYAADAWVGMAAIMDASECPPTFGAERDQVRVLVTEDFQAPLPDLQLENHRLAHLVPEQAKGHMVLFLAETKLNPEQVRFRAMLGARAIYCSDVFPTAFLEGIPSPSPIAARGRIDLLGKWILNAVSTSVFIGYGKVYGNRMIDLRISNRKLWERARRLVQSLGDVTEVRAQSLLCRVIGMEPPLGEETSPELITRAAQLPRVVPTAILMARRGMSPGAARALLQRAPKIRDCL